MIAWLSLVLAVAVAVPAQRPAAVVVPVADLVKDPALVGTEVTVEGRKPKFEFHRAKGWNEFQFAGSPVLFRLPDRLSYPAPPNIAVLRVRAILGREGASRFVAAVIAVEPLPSDAERLKRDLAAMRPGEIAGREAAAAWAEKRAAEYHDQDLLTQARTTLGEAIRLTSELPASQQPERQLELAEKARTRGVPAPEPSALAHRGLRGLLRQTKSAADAQGLADRAEAVLGETQATAEPAGLAAWLVPYDADPADAYRRAPPAMRAALDRRMIGDVLQHAFELQAGEHPENAVALADKALAKLPDRPALSAQLRRKGLESTDVSALRLNEVQDRAKQYERLGDPEAARALLRRWLDDKRAGRLGAQDAEGRVLLASQYEQLLGDKATATALLHEAWRIDPEANSIAEAFLKRGFRRVGNDWVPPADRVGDASETSGVEDAPRADHAARNDSLIGQTREEVRAVLGKPNAISRVATQGQVVEQWIYSGSASRSTQYINFLIRPGTRRVTVVAHTSRRS